MRKVWLRVTLAAGAGFASLVGCSAVLVAIVLLFTSTTDWFVIMGSSSGPAPIFWVGLVILIIVAAAGLSLPARALGAKRDHVTNTALLSGSWLLCVRGFPSRVLCRPLCWRASSVDGDSSNPGHRVPGCHPRGLPLYGSSGPSDRDRGGGHLLCFVARRVARHLVGSWGGRTGGSTSLCR